MLLADWVGGLTSGRDRLPGSDIFGGVAASVGAVGAGALLLLGRCTRRLLLLLAGLALVCGFFAWMAVG